MAEEVGIVMSLYDRVSPTLKAIAGNSAVFDKNLDDLEASLKAYDKAQDAMVKKSADLKKALAEADQQVKTAQKSYRKLNDEASKRDLDKAIDRQAELRRELSETEINLKANSKAYEDLYDKARKAAKGIGETSLKATSKAYEDLSIKAKDAADGIADASDAISRMENRAGRSGGAGGGLIDSLGKAGAWSMAGDVLSQWADVWIGSATSGETGTLLSGALSGIGSGAAIGSMIAPGIGTAVGAVAGGLVGLASGAAQNFENEDEAFKSYVQTAAEGQMEARETSIASGSDTAAQRELDAIAFNTLISGGSGKQFLADLREMAAVTPFEYEDLTTMSRNLAIGFGDDPDRILSLMKGIGNAGATVNASESDMNWLATSLSRMQSTDLAQLAEINMFQDRGIDVIGMLADAYGKNEGEIRSMITGGEIGGRDAVDIIQQGLDQYAGAMDEMARTFSGLTSTLADTTAEMDNAAGEGYNEVRSRGLQEEIDAYSGLLGDAVADINRIAGENAAYLENLSEQYTREALSAVLLGENTTLFDPEQKRALQGMRAEFLEASAAYENGSREAGIKMETLRSQAEALAEAAYDSSSAALAQQEAELDLISAIRENTVALDGWRVRYETDQEYTKGLAAAMWANAGNEEVSSQQTEEPLRSVPDVTFPRLELQYTVDPAGSLNISGIKPVQSLTSKPSHAYGLDRVPYDNYTALLHQGERVLTASQAREMDRGGLAKGTINVNISGSWSVRSPEDVDEIAETIVRKIELAAKAGVNR